MAAETITQIRANYPAVTLANTDLFLLDQANRTIAATIAELAAFVRPAVATTTAAGLMSAADKTKLNSVPANATANSTDSFLLNRENHQGQQNISTITGLGTRLTNIETTAQGQATAIEALQNQNPAPAIEALEDRVTAVEDWDELAETRIGDLESDVAALQAPHVLILKEYTLATLPPAAANNRAIVEVSDAADGPTVVRSNGTAWMILNTTTEVA